MLKKRDYPSSMLRFHAACMEESGRIIGEMGPLAYQNIMFSISKTRHVKRTPQNSSGKSSPRQNFFRQLFFDYLEIYLAYETLADFPILSHARLNSNSRLPASHLLAFWQEAYLNEFYIFQCRLETFIKHVARAYRKDYPGLNEKGVQGAIKTLGATFFNSLQKLRGSHVHIQRCRHSDPKLHRIELLEMLLIENKTKEILHLYKAAIKQCQKQNLSNFRVFTSVAKNSLTVVFRAFERILLDADGRFVYPKALKPVR